MLSHPEVAPTAPSAISVAPASPALPNPMSTTSKQNRAPMEKAVADTSAACSAPGTEASIPERSWQSACARTETYSPEAIENAPATQAATPVASSMSDWPALSRPSNRLDMEMMPSLAPSRAARNQCPRSCRSSWGESPTSSLAEERVLSASRGSESVVTELDNGANKPVFLKSRKPSLLAVV